jgi:hypothetical protein
MLLFGVIAEFAQNPVPLAMTCKTSHTMCAKEVQQARKS